MADTTPAPLTKSQIFWAAVLRFVRAAVAIGLPQLVAYLAGHPDVRWAALAPVIMAVAKYLRDSFGWNWLPV